MMGLLSCLEERLESAKMEDVKSVIAVCEDWLWHPKGLLSLDDETEPARTLRIQAARYLTRARQLLDERSAG
jgi:hypothetical protein